jgi:multimeric flavodoxin WrbA
MMRVLGIYGSPRKDGNTDLMLDAFLEGCASSGAEVERIYVRDLEIRGCLECGHCDKAGECVLRDDMAKVYPLLEGSSRIVAAAPIFFYGVPGQLKLLVDRSQAMYMKHELAKKEGKQLSSRDGRKGFLLSAGATRGKRLFECAILTMKYFYDALNMGYAGELCFSQVEGKGDIHNHPTALADCRQAGEAFTR